jgi:mannan endo-1,4-beta-mannosidase
MLIRSASVAHVLLLLSVVAGCGSSGDDDATDGGTDDGGSTDAHADHKDAEADGRSDATTKPDAGKDKKDGGGHDAEPDRRRDATGDDGGPADAATDQDATDAGTAVSFSIDMSLGPARQFQPPAKPAPVSPYIYGINASGESGAMGDFTQKKTSWGLVRMGGNAFTDWNWTTNYLNLGGTDCFSQGPSSGGSALAGAVTQSVDSISAAKTEGAAYIATVPIVDHVSAAVVNDTSADCPAMASDCVDGGGTVSTTYDNSNNLDFVSSDPNSVAFVANAPQKPGGAYCACAPAQACDAGCTVSTNPVYQDEFVHFIETTYPSSGAPIFFDLDNEPNYWGSTHPEVWPFTGVVPCETAAAVTYDDVVTRDMTYAAAIKTASPTAKVFGPVVAQDGIVYAHSYTDPHLPTEFVDYYLAQMAGATSSLLDVFDVHYYNEQNSSPTQCLQNPRMFWDPNYTELSATATDMIDFQYSGLNNDFDTNWYPRKMIPRLLGKIATAYASSAFGAPPLSFSEYNSGCETVIAGAIAEADDLGIFGREGVFAGALMPLDTPTSNYALAAVDLYRNYDGNGAVVGDTAVRATTSNVETTSVYAFAHSTNAAAVDVIAINKAASVVVATVSIANAPALTGATLYDIVDGSASVVAATGTAPTIACTGTTCTLTYRMPPMSATTLILR